MAEFPSRWLGRRFVALSESAIAQDLVTITSRRAIRLREGDIVLRMSRSSGDLVFVRAQEIESTELKPPGRDAERDDFVFQAKLSAEDAVDLGNISLSELAFSLTKVTRTDNPSVHFRRKYTYVPAFDAGVIASGEVFWARTALGMLGMALPETARISILAAIIHEDPQAANDLNRAWTSFREIVDGEYVRPAYLLTRTVENLESTLEDEGVRRLTIVDPEDGGAPLQLVARKAEAQAVVDAFRYDPDSDRSILLAEIDQTVRESSGRDAERFGAAFKKSRWPFGVLT